MTSFAFIFGVIPLLVGTGAGSEMRRTLGVAVFSGMLGVTLFGIFLTPVFFNVIEWFIDLRGADAKRKHRVSEVLLFPLRTIKVGVVWVATAMAHAMVSRAARKPMTRVVEANRRPTVREGKAVVADDGDGNGKPEKHDGQAVRGNGHVAPKSEDKGIRNGDARPPGDSAEYIQEK
jgi:hypothetical protein